MGRKKTDFSNDSPTKDKEDLSTTEEFDTDSDSMEEVTVSKNEDVDTRTSGDEEANDNEIGAQEVVVPVKRGRGRPSNSHKRAQMDHDENEDVDTRTSGDEANNNEIEAQEVVVPVKRGRGRPPSLHKHAAVHGENAVKRKRGRPKKDPSITNSTEKASKKSKKKGVYLQTYDGEEYPQKRIGRPRKQTQVVMETDETDEVDYLEWYADDHDESVVKKKRGRPKKSDSPNGRKKSSKSGRKSSRKSLPRMLLADYAEEEYYPQKRRGRPRKDTNSKNELRLGSQVDRLGSLVDRLENRINLDGLIDEDTDIESEQEIDKQIFILQRNFNVKLDLKNDFKLIVKSYLEDLGAVQGCLIATVRSYKNSGRIVLYEIWESEAEQSDFSEECLSRIFETESSEMLKNNAVVKNMNIPARWWQRTR